MENKFFLKSKTIWGVIITAIPVLLPAFGMTFSPDDTHLISQFGDTALELFGLGLSAYGRFAVKTAVKVV